MLQVPCPCRPSSLVHLNESHTSSKLHGLERRRPCRFGWERWRDPNVFEKTLSFTSLWYGNTFFLVYFWRCQIKKEKVREKFEMTIQFESGPIQLISRFLIYFQNQSKHFAELEGCSLGPRLWRWRGPHWGLRIWYFHHKNPAFDRVFVLGFFSLWLCLFYGTLKGIRFILLVEEIPNNHLGWC